MKTARRAIPLPASEAQEGWRDIASAPKDGSRREKDMIAHAKRVRKADAIIASWNLMKPTVAPHPAAPKPKEKQP